MFDLEQTIADWRREMLAAGIKTPVPLEELETHLHEEIERQMKSGLNEQKAFEISVRQIGEANSLKMEFTKIDETSHLWERKLMRLFCPAFAFLYLLWCSYFLFKIEMSAVERIMGFVAVAVFVLIWSSMPQFYRFVPVIPDKRRRKITQAVASLFWPVSGIFAANFILPHVDLTCAQLIVTVLLAMIPAGFFAAVSYGMGAVAYGKVSCGKA
ncbi:MAG TPA: permease prefix domain 1-containing protein [Verrucomicrobiae bacterium]|nr:permease prefix domain 1-containing protein [Verrucomicrobiae bacterium]